MTIELVPIGQGPAAAAVRLGENLYATLADLKARLGETGTERDAQMAGALLVASRHIDRVCRRHFFTRQGVVYVDAAGRINGWEQWNVGMLLHDLLSASEVAVDRTGNGTFGEVWALGSDFALWPWNSAPASGIAVLRGGRYGLPEQAQARWMRITGTWGYGDGEGRAWGTGDEGDGLTATVATTGGRVLTLGSDLTGGLQAGHTIQVESEQMTVESVTSGTPGVPAHDAEPEVPMVAATVRVTRAINGTTAAAHAAAAVGLAAYPALIVDATLTVATRVYSRMGGETLQAETIGDYNYRRYLPEQEVAMDAAWLSGFAR